MSALDYPFSACRRLHAPNLRLTRQALKNQCTNGRSVTSTHRFGGNCHQTCKRRASRKALASRCQIHPVRTDPDDADEEHRLEVSKPFHSSAEDQMILVRRRAWLIASAGAPLVAGADQLSIFTYGICSKPDYLNARSHAND